MRARTHERNETISRLDSYAGSGPISGYVWVEVVGGTPVLSGDAIDLARSDDASNGTEVASELSGFRKGYGILPGALAAVNVAGFSDFSDQWPAAT